MDSQFQEPVHLSGNSMYPAIKDSDQLGIEFFDRPVDLGKLKIGEVVLVRDGHEWIAHRVVEKDGQKTTKGDWSNQFDGSHSVWGVIRKVNGRHTQLISSEKISTLSGGIDASSSKVLRKILKFKLWTQVRWIQFKEMIWSSSSNN